MVQKPWQKKGLRSFEDYKVKWYASKMIIISEKNHLEFFLKIESFFVPKSIKIYGHIFKCIFSVDYNVIEVK